MYALFDITYSDRPVMVKRGEFEICQAYMVILAERFKTVFKESKFIILEIVDEDSFQYYMDHTSLWAEYIKNTIQAIEKMG